ncbi:MAG: hypothetical protein WAV21_02520 [Minisyncoccia bacterium]
MTTLRDIEKRALHSVHYGDRIQPVRDWVVLLGVGLVLFLGSIAWNLWLFVRVSSGEEIGTPSSAASGVNTDILQQAQEVFQARKVEEENYKNNYHFVDPSK